MQSRVAVLLPLAGLALAGCSPDLSIPAGAMISCATASDCPSDLVCHQGLCVAAAGLDTTPPDLASAPIVTPEVGRAGTRFEIAIEPSEPLVRAPEVTLRLLVPATAPCTADGAAWRCEYTATGDENGGLGGVVPFDVRLVDVGQNATLRALAGVLDLDFGAPVLASASVAPAAARLGSVLQIFFATSEPLASEPVLVASRPLDEGGPTTRFNVPAQPGTLNHLFTHLVTPGDASGPIDFTVEATDLAGNSATLPVGSLTVDALGPIVSAPAVSPARIDETGTVTATFDVSEPAASLEVTVGGRPMACGAYSASTPSYTCTRQMTGTEIPSGTEAAQAVLVAVADAAGNPAQGSGSVVFDFRPPAVATAAIAYVPDAANPLQAVARARAGTSIRVSITADEALDMAAPPSLSMPGVPAFALVPATLGPTGATFESAAPALPDGDYPLTVSWSDAAGNAADQVLPAPVRIKTSVPSLTIDQAAVTFVRAPWGVADVGDVVTVPALPSGQPFAALASADPLSPGDRLPASAFAAPGGVAMLRAWKDPAQMGLLVSRILPNADGTWPRALVPGGEDLPTAWVTAVDDAGNESPPVRIANAEWIATAGRPAAGDSPHAVHSSYYAQESLVPDPSVSDPRAPGPPLLGLVQRAHTALRRRSAATASAPSVRADFATAFDPARGRLVLHGGRGPTGETFTDTWEWDGTSWSDVTPSSGYGPHPAARSSMTYDGARGRVVLEDSAQQVWEWDGLDWVRRFATGGCADPGGPMAWDALRERAVVVPRVDAPSFFSCEWDGSRWSASSLGADPPRPLSDAAMAYDARRGVMVFHGGLDESVYPSVASGELWERQGTAWSLVAQSGAVPGPRHGHALVYDPVSERILLLGGADGSGALHADVRAWDGTAWVVVTPAGQPPPARRRAGVVHDPGRSRLVVHGGLGAGDTFLDDTWELGPDGWENVTVGRPTPAARRAHAMAYDPLRGVVVLHGGRDLYGELSDVWEYDGRAWRDVTPAAALPSPGARSGHAMAFHAASGRLLVFGGFSSQASAVVSDLWEWTGSAWVDRTPAASPPARELAGLSDDPARGVLVLVGGYTYTPTSSSHLTDHWELSAPGGVLTWTQRSASLPAGLPRSEHAQYFDGSRTLVTGGFRIGAGTASDVWALSGGAWTQIVPDTPGSAAAPDSRGGGVWDPVRGRGVLQGDPVQTWYPYRLEWTGIDFDVIRPTSTERWALDDRLQAGIAFDARRGRAVIHGGGDGSSRVVGDTWEVDADLVPGPSGPVQRRAPAVQLMARYTGAGFTEDRVQALRVRARAGGGFASAGSGARLLGWSRSGPGNPGGRWVTLAENADGIPLAGSPAGFLEWSAPAADLRRFFRERDRELAFQLRPAGAPPPGAVESTVQVEYMEVRVRYSVP